MFPGYIKFLFSILAIVILPQTIQAQEQFFDAIVCYECVGKAVNSSCADPLTKKDLEKLGTVGCKQGACIKWTYYVDDVLIMRRTCSMEVDMHIMLASVCQHEKFGNGDLCMCSDDLCNSSVKLTSKTFHLVYSFLCIAIAYLILVDAKS